jgi:AcrR family transcriptional regulator
VAVKGRSKPSAGEATRAKIIAAALETLHEEGIVGTSARSIAARGGFNQGLIFYHFGGINDLLLAAVDELSKRREERYRERLEGITTLSALVAVAGELHQQDMEDGHITVLTQMLAGVATNPDLREPLRERFQPWIQTVHETVERAIGDTPYASLVPMKDLALAVTAVFLGLELLLSLEDEAGRADQEVFRSIGFLAGVLELLLDSLPAPPQAD